MNGFKRLQKVHIWSLYRCQANNSIVVFIINCVGVNGRFAYLSFALTPAACLPSLTTR